jgi:hypothetical protein
MENNSQNNINLNRNNLTSIPSNTRDDLYLSRNIRRNRDSHSVPSQLSFEILNPPPTPQSSLSSSLETSSTPSTPHPNISILSQSTDNYPSLPVSPPPLLYSSSTLDELSRYRYTQLNTPEIQSPSLTELTESTDSIESNINNEDSSNDNSNDNSNIIIDEKIYDKLLDIFLKTSEFSNNIERWVKKQDITILDEVNLNYEELIDISSIILMEIPEKIKNDIEIKSFIEIFNNITSEIINYTITNNIIWNINLKDKIIWIALMLAMKTSPKVIPYLVNNFVKKNVNIIEKEDIYGCNCIILACYNTDSIIELIKLFSIEYLEKYTSNHICALDLLTYNGGIIPLLKKGIIDYNYYFNYKNKYNGMNAIHMALMADIPFTIKFLMSEKKLENNLLYNVDNNNNIPLMVSFLTLSIETINLLFNKKIYDKKVLENKNIIDYISNKASKDILSVFLKYNYITEEIFFNIRLYDCFEDNVIFHEFINSSLFTYDIITKEYEENKNILYNKFFNNVHIIKILVNSNNTKIINLMEEIFLNNKNILLKIFDNNINIVTEVLKSKYMTNDLLLEKYNNVTLIEKIKKIGNLDFKYIKSFVLIVKELINCKLINKEIVYEYGLDIFIVKNYVEFVHILFDRNLIINPIKILKLMVSLNYFDRIYKLIEDKYINISLFINNLDMIKKMIYHNEKFLILFISNIIFEHDIIKVFTNKYNIIDWSNNVINYPIKKHIILKLLKNKFLTTRLLNNFNIIYGSILNNINSWETFEILIKTRTDFNHNLIYKIKNNQTNFFMESYFILSDEKIVEYLLNSESYTEDKYIILLKSMVLCDKDFFQSKKINLLKLIINCKYSDERLLQLEFDNKNNLLMYVIKKKYDSLIKNIIEHKSMTNEILSYKNIYGNNCLMLALMNNINCDYIIESKHFNSDMLITKNKNNISVIDILYKYNVNINLVIKYLNSYPDINSLKHKYTGGNTILHKLIKNKVNFNKIINLVDKFGIEILLIKNNYNLTCLHIISQVYGYNDILKLIELINKKPNIWKTEYLYITNKYNKIPLINIIERFAYDDKLNENIIKYKIITEDKFKFKITEKNIYLIEQIIDSNYRLLSLFEKYNFNIDRLLHIKSETKNFPIFHNLVYKSCGNNDIDLSKYLTNKMINFICENNKKLLSNYIIYDTKLFINLVKNNVIKNRDIQNIIVTELIFLDDIINYLIENKIELFTEKILLDCIEKCLYNKLTLINKFCDYYNLLSNELKSNPEKLKKFINCKYNLNFLLQNNLLMDNILSINNYEILFKSNNYLIMDKLINIIDIKNLSKIKYNDTLLLNKLSLYPHIVYNLIKKYKDENNDINNLIIFDNNNKIYIDVLIDNNFIDDVLKILDLYSGEIIYKLIVRNNIINDKLIKKLCETNELLNILNKIDISLYELLSKCDNKNNNMLYYIYKYSLSLFNKLLDDVIDYKLLINNNKNNIDLIKIITKDNFKLLEKILVKIKDRYEYFDECFIIACKYNSKSLRILLNNVTINFLHYGLIEYENNKYPANYFQIACRYNSDAVKLLLENNEIDLEEVIEEIYDKNNISFNSLKLAILYQPLALKYILDNDKYINKNIILQTNKIMKDGCLLEALTKQIASYPLLFESKYITCILYHPTHGNINDKYNYIINNYDKNIDKLLTSIDVPTNLEDNELCTICYENKYRIIFSPCEHKSCITCSIKIHKCHQCREIIKDKLIYN